MFGKNLVRVFTYQPFSPKGRGKMTYKNILVSGKSLSKDTNARVRACAPNGRNATYRLTTYHDTLELAGLTAGQDCDRITSQAQLQKEEK